MTSTTVSVVIPTHNRGPLLAATLRATLAQQEVEVEVIVVDDGSTDDTGAVVARLDDARVKLLRNPVPRGVSAARNRGIANATAEWIAFLDDDDLWAPGKLALQLEAARAGRAGWAYGGAVAVDPGLRILAGGPPPSSAETQAAIALRNTVSAGASNVIVSREVLTEAGDFDTGLRHMSDWDLWIRLAQQGPPAVVDRPLVAYRIHPGNASLDTAEIGAELEVLSRRYADLRGFEPVDRAYVYRWIAWSSLRAGQRREALRAYWQAFRSGDTAALARGVVGLVAPGVAQRGLRRHRAHRAWLAEAEGWLRDAAAAE